MYLGRALQQQGRLVDAENVLTASIALDPSVADAYLVLGSVLIDAGRPKEAIEVLEHAFNSSKQLAVVFAYRGAALAALGRWDDAITACEEGVRLEGSNTKCWTVLAEAYGNAGRHRDAKYAQKMVAHLGATPSSAVPSFDDT